MTDRLNRANQKVATPGGTSVQGLNLYTIKGLGPRGRFYGPGARRTQKTKKLRKRSEAMEAIHRGIGPQGADGVVDIEPLRMLRSDMLGPVEY